MVKKDEVLYWSFGEMVEFDAQITAESEVACGNDEMCKEMYIYEQREQSSIPEKYRALEYFRGVCRLIFPTINPATEFLGVYYRDRDDTMGMGPANIREIYIAWVENSVPDPRYQAYWDGDDAITPYVADMRRGFMSPGVHELYHGTSAIFGENWFTPYSGIAIDASNSRLAENQNHLIHFTVLATNNGNMLGATDYSSCFDWGTYEEGMECRIMYSGTGWPVYFPAFPGGEIPEVEVVPEPTPEEPTLEEPTIDEPIPDDPIPDEPIIDEPAIEEPIPDNPTSEDSTPEISTSTIGVLTTPVDKPLDISNLAASTKPISNTTASSDDTAITTTVATPDMTSATSPQESIEVPLAAGKEKAHEFPWWFIVFIFSGIALILWWFIPLPKRRKKSEKSLDKSDQIE